MKPAPFDYIRPEFGGRSERALGRRGATTAAIAGGQSLVPTLALRVALPELLVDISRLDDLKIVTRDTRQPLAGALTTHAAIEDGRRAGHLQRPDAAGRGADFLSRGAQPRHHRRQRGAG